MSSSLKLVFAGTPAPAVPALERLLASRHEVVAVVTRPDAPAGRGRQLQPSPVKEVAAAHNLEVLTPAKASDPEFQARLSQLAPDCCPVVAYGALLPKSVLDIPRYGWANLHFSLLPAWRGAAPVQHAIANGDDLTGASVFRIEEGLDTGPIYGTLTEPILPTDTSGALLNRLSVSGAELLVRCLDAVADGTVHAVPQSVDGVSMAPKITVHDARLDWHRPAYAIDRAIRAYTPSPGAWSVFRDVRVKLEPVTLEPSISDLAPGELRAERRRVLVGTATHAVALGTVQQHGKKAMPATDWARGVHPQSGESFA